MTFRTKVLLLFTLVNEDHPVSINSACLDPGLIGRLADTKPDSTYLLIFLNFHFMSISSSIFYWCHLKKYIVVPEKQKSARVVHFSYKLPHYGEFLLVNSEKALLLSKSASQSAVHDALFRRSGLHSPSDRLAQESKNRSFRHRLLRPHPNTWPNWRSLHNSRVHFCKDPVVGTFLADFRSGFLE